MWNLDLKQHQAVLKVIQNHFKNKEREKERKEKKKNKKSLIGQRQYLELDGQLVFDWWTFQSKTKLSGFIGFSFIYCFDNGVYYAFLSTIHHWIQ